MRSGARLARLLGVVALFTLLGCGLLVCAGSVRGVLAQGGGSTPLAPCPPPDSLGEGTSTPGPDDVSWDYLLECRHCLAMTPTPTSWWVLATPTVAVRGFHADCPTDYALLKGGYAVTPLVLHDKVQRAQTYGAVFTVRYATTPGEGHGAPSAAQHAYEPGFIPSQYTPLWLKSSPSYFSAFEDGQRYCAVAAGYTDLCARFAPGAEVRLLAGDGRYIPAPSLSAPLTLPVYLSETVDPFWFEDVQVLYYGEAGPACPIAPDVALNWRETCPEDVVVAHDGDFTHFEVTVGGVGWDYPTDVHAVLFDVQASGAEVRLAQSAGSRNYFTMDIIGVPLREWTVCVGDEQVCTRLSSSEPMMIVQQNVVDVSQPHVMGFNVAGGAVGNIALRNLRYGVYGDGRWSCEAPTPTPLPTSTPMPTSTPLPTNTPIVVGGVWRGVVWPGGVLVEGSPSVTIGGTTTWTVNTFRTAQTGLYLSGGGLYCAYIDQTLAYPGGQLSQYEVVIRLHFSSGSSDYRTGVWDAARGAYCYTMPWGSNTVVSVSVTIKVGGKNLTWQLHRLEVSAPWRTGYATPTPVPVNTPIPTSTLTPTLTLTATQTAVPPTVVMTPTLDPERCRTYEWKPVYDPAVGVAGDWEGLLEPGECYDVIPGLSITTPDLGAVGDLIGLDSYSLEWEGFRYCIMWVNFPSVSILGLSLSLEWFLLPAVAWLLNKLAEM